MIEILLIAYYFLIQPTCQFDSSFVVQKDTSIENKAMRILLQKCSDCHSVPTPKDSNLKNWRDSLPRMMQKAHLTNQEYEILIKYINKAASTWCLETLGSNR